MTIDGRYLVGQGILDAGLAATAKKREALERSKVLLADGQRVEAVKAYRVATGASLSEAQRALGIKQ